MVDGYVGAGRFSQLPGAFFDDLPELSVFGSLFTQTELGEFLLGENIGQGFTAVDDTGRT